MKNSKVRRLAVGAVLAAIIVVLQLVAGYIKIGPASITLALAPIIVGGALYGRSMGAFLGCAFSVAVLIEPGTAAFYGVNWWATVIIVLLKGILGGYLAALVYELLAPKSRLLAVITSGIVLPLVNTGIFIIGSYFFFVPLFVPDGSLSGLPLLWAIALGSAVNFAIELGVNLLLSTGITTVIKAVKK